VSDPKLLHGAKPGDRRVRVDRPYARYFRYSAPGILTAKLSAHEPTTGLGRAMARTRRVAFGRPLSNEEEMEQRLSKVKALPVFSSDVMSSVAYATEASLFTLLAAGSQYFYLVMPISIAIVGVLALVTLSYRQTIRAYPSGGGSYIVAKANLGVLAGLVAAAALLVDYVLTVAVSVSSGVQALASALPVLFPFTVPLIVLSIVLVTAANLRGLRESGTLFASPTYIFLGSMLLLIGLGMFQALTGQSTHVTGVTPALVTPETFGLLLLMRAFADGCSAMTGTEAVANGVPAFKPPEWKNAQQTMLIMSLLLGTMFLSTSFLAGATGAIPAASGESVLSQIGRSVFGIGPLYYVLQFATMGILILAAQTSFADFPRVASILARDGYFPRQFAFRGERLAFNAGILVLALMSIVLVIAFNGRVEALIPLYAVGVFTAFTLSQSGMVRHWLTERGPGWRRSIAINAVGATATGIVAVIFAVAKFSQGAWIVLIIVPLLVAAMVWVGRQYQHEERSLAVKPKIIIAPPNRPQHVVVAAPAFSRAVVQAIRVAQTMGSTVEVVHVTADRTEGEEFLDRVQEQVPGTEVVVVESPYRTLVNPFVHYLESRRAEDPGEVTIVLLPVYVARHWWQRVLYNQNTQRIRNALLGRKDIVVLDVPYRLDEDPDAAAA
jgi:amino acid transporter